MRTCVLILLILVTALGCLAAPAFDAQAATDRYLASVPAADRARSDAYFEGGYWLILWDFLYGAVVMIVLLETGLSARMRSLAERISRRRPIQTFLYWIEYLVVVSVVTFPLTVYEEFFRERKYGLMNQTFGAWLGDQGKEFVLGAILGGVLVVALFGIVRKLERTWHLWGTAVAIVFMMFSMLIGPVWISPMFNKYTKLQDPKIKEPILSLARANGIPATDVYQVDASRQSKRVSANVSGFLGTERITLNDNLLKRCTPDEIMSVMGHEMGHYVLNHIYKFLFYAILLALILFAALRKLLDWSLGRWGARWGITGIGDPAVLPLALLILSVFIFVLTPVNNTMVRVQEYEADVFGLNAARQPDAEATVDLKLGEYRKLDPTPLEEFLFFDHPSGRTRIYTAMRWKAENLPAAH